MNKPSAAKGHIAFLINGMGSGGSQKNVAILANHFVSIGYSVAIISVYYDDCFYQLDPAVKLVSFIPPFLGNLLSSKKIRRFWLKIKAVFWWRKNLPSLIKSMGTTTMITIGTRFSYLGLSLSSKLPGVKIITRETGGSGLQMSLAEKMIAVVEYRKAFRCVFQTESELSRFPPSIKKKAVILPNPIVVENGYIDYFSEGFSSKRVVTVGRISIPIKGHDTLLRSFALIHDRHPDFQLHIYGTPSYFPGDLPELKKMAFELGISNCVFFEGDSKAIHHDISKSFCFLFTSTTEGMPNALIEAQLLGIPVISTSWPGSKEVIASSKNGLLVPIGDEKSIAADVDLLCQNPTLYSQLSKGGINSACHYDPETILQCWDNLLSLPCR